MGLCLEAVTFTNISPVIQFPRCPLLPSLAAALLICFLEALTPEDSFPPPALTFRRQKEASLGRNLGRSFRIVLWPHPLPWRARPLSWRLHRRHSDYSSTSPRPIFTLGIWWGFWMGSPRKYEPSSDPSSCKGRDCSPLEALNSHATAHSASSNLSKLPFKCFYPGLLLQVSRLCLCPIDVPAYTDFGIAVCPVTSVLWCAQEKSLVFSSSRFFFL